MSGGIGAGMANAVPGSASRASTEVMVNTRRRVSRAMGCSLGEAGSGSCPGWAAGAGCVDTQFREHGAIQPRRTPNRVCPSRRCTLTVYLVAVRRPAVGAFTNISEQDLRRLLDVVSPDAVDDDGLEIPGQVLRGLAELIPSACVSFFAMDTRARQVTAGQEIVLADLPEEDLRRSTTRCSRRLLGLRGLQLAGGVWRPRPGHHVDGLLLRAGVRPAADGRVQPPVGGSGTSCWSACPRKVAWSAGSCWRGRVATGRTANATGCCSPCCAPTWSRSGTTSRAGGARRPTLTPRQLQLLRRVADGHTNRQIARDLGLSEGTVRKHLEHIYARLEVGSRTEALARMRDVLAS